MKIVNRQDFLKLPSGTIYSKYEPCTFEGLAIKGESLFYDHCANSPYCHDDFYTQQIESAIECSGSREFINRLKEMREKGVSYPIDLKQKGRDGLYEKEQLFMVWEKEDLLELKKTIDKAISVC